MAQLRVVILKPSKYTTDGSVERFRCGFMPNSTVPYIRSMTPAAVGECPTEVHTIDEYVHTDLRYLSLLNRATGSQTLLALVGVQSHQFHRALDLAAYARRNGCQTIIGGPHAAWRRIHPMSGGIRRARVNGVSDYLSLRKAQFDFEQAPLPRACSYRLRNASLTKLPSHRPTPARHKGRPNHRVKPASAPNVPTLLRDLAAGVLSI